MQKRCNIYYYVPPEIDTTNYNREGISKPYLGGGMPSGGRGSAPPKSAQWLVSHYRIDYYTLRVCMSALVIELSGHTNA